MYNNFKTDKVAKEDFDYEAYQHLIELNNHYIETIRSPILFQVINFKSVIIASIATIFLMITAYITFKKTVHKLVYWK